MSRHPLPPTAAPSRGFTLLELVIAMAVAAILMTVALPSFADALRRARRAEGTHALLQLQLAQERWRTDHPRYAAALSDIGLPGPTPNGHYQLAIASADDAGFVATATAAGVQAGDARCMVLKLEHRLGRTLRTSVDSGGVAADDQPNRCWQ